MGPPRLVLRESEPAAPLVEELAPAPDPWDAARRLAGLPGLILFDSAGGPAELARYSFVAADPFAHLRSRRGVWWEGEAPAEPRPPARREPRPPTPGRPADPFAELAAQLRRLRSAPAAGLPPFQGGAAGLFGYDLCHHLERLPRPRADEFALPDLDVGLYDWAVAFDHRKRAAWVVSTGLPETDPRRRRRRAERRLAEVRRRLRLAAKPGPEAPPPERVAVAPSYPLPGRPGVFSNFDRAGYLAAVRRAVEYVHAGDCFQVNLAQRLLAPAAGPALELYEPLRPRNPAPFAGYYDGGDYQIVSASPERFLRVQGGEVVTRPIKGTRPRGDTPDRDAARAAELLASAKDRAENVMIVDLLRNDLGRVCAYGSVRVGAVCRLETYPTVHHLVSEVTGRLRPGLGPIDLLRAAFPGGSVTGAPKVRAMQIIAELEPHARGPYCGALGYLGLDGSMDTSILIRTFTVAGGRAWFPVGGGLVADSDPEAEHAETLDKAEGLLRALG